MCLDETGFVAHVLVKRKTDHCKAMYDTAVKEMFTNWFAVCSVVCRMLETIACRCYWSLLWKIPLLAVRIVIPVISKGLTITMYLTSTSAPLHGSLKLLCLFSIIILFEGILSIERSMTRAQLPPVKLVVLYATVSYTEEHRVVTENCVAFPVD